MSNFEQLIYNLGKMSTSMDYWIIKSEWQLVRIEEESLPTVCECGHSPIVNLCHIKNIKTGKTTIIGNSCIKQFLPDYQHLFTDMKKLRANKSTTISIKTIEYAFKNNFINATEYSFLNNIRNKRKLSEKQLSFKTSVNTKIFNKIKNMSK